MKFLLLLATLVISNNAFAHDEARLFPLKELILNDGRTIIVDGNQMTVYTFDQDTTSESTCYDNCAVAWPPVLLPNGVQVADPIGTTVRKDGNLQLTFEGKPIYHFIKDKSVGDTKGDNIGKVWHIILD